MTHELKIHPDYFDVVASNVKTFEIRENDRNYQVGDWLILKEWYRGKFTGRELKRYVTYVYRGNGAFGLSEGYCVMSIVEIDLNSVVVNQNGNNCVCITNAGTINL